MPKQETLDRALAEIAKGYAQYQYFFDHLNSPAWLAPLANRGFFQHPPEPEHQGEYVRFAWWPESRYLVRMSQVPAAQEKVLEIALRIPDSENSRVHDDVADMALFLPADMSAQLIPQVSRYIEYPVQLLLSEKIANLIVHLAEGGQGHGALRLARAALRLTPTPRRGEDAAEELLSTPEPQSRFRDWYYVRIVQKAARALLNSVGIDALRLFCDLLDEAARLSLRETETGDEDYFYIRHPAIESGTGRDDIPSSLLCAVRDAAIQLISRDPAQFHPVIGLLQQQKWTSFRRLELHISRVFLDQGIEVAERIFEDPTVLDRASLTHEAVLLLKESFGRFSAKRQESILQWMDAAPPKESIRKFLEFVGESITDEKIDHVWRIRRRNHFSILEGQLPEAYQRTYDQLKAELGEPEPPERLPVRTFSQAGAQSPKPAAELETMSVNEVMAFLGSWTPGTDVLAPTAAGLGGALTTIVSQRPREFVAVAEGFRDLDPTYVRCFFAGLNSALKKDEKWDWIPVLELARWVTAQPREIQGRKGGLMVADPDWGWTRDSIIDLVNTGFEGGAKWLRCEHRSLVWSIIAPLTDDSFPSPDDERGERFDPSFLSINCTRGRALYAALYYARWVRLCAEARGEGAPQLSLNLSAMPELREVLDRHLDLLQEPTLTIRSIYGHDLGWLANLDWDWFRANVERILPLGDEQVAYFNAAWESFVVFNQPNNALLRELIPAYRRAVNEVAKMRRSTMSLADPADRLGEHLIAYYWRGHLDFSGSDRLLEDFYANAPDGIRGHAMWFIGRSAPGWEEAPPDVFERLRNLVERRLRTAEQSAAISTFSKELANFGWWFTSDKFGDEWSIQMLLRILRLTKRVEGDMDVVKRLAELSSRYPAECIACLRLMVEGDRDRWMLIGVENDAERLIKTALNSDRPDAVMSASRLIEDLIARGHYGFRNLLT
jgi:hypothetical protein